MLYLASTSPRRQQLLKQAGLKFRVVPPVVDEWNITQADPGALVLHNSYLKALSVSEQYSDAPVLAADTAVAINGRVLNKPEGMDEACQMLRVLSAQTHIVYTGICLVYRQKNLELKRCIKCRVSFNVLDEEGMQRYFSLVNPLDKAGAYGIQEGRNLIIDYYEGALSNIMGLPIKEILYWLNYFRLSSNYLE